MLVFAIVVALVLYGAAAPDRVTLGVTRGAAGAVRASIGSTRSRRSAARSARSDRGGGPARATRRSTRSKSTSPTRSTRSSRTRSTPDPIDPTRSRSRVARAIDGWIDGADGAARRRGEAAAALGRLRDRARDRKAAKQRAAAEDEAWAENDRRDRAEQRARTGEAVKEIADQYPGGTVPITTKEMAQGFGVIADKSRLQRQKEKTAKMTGIDTDRISPTDLENLDQAEAEILAAYRCADSITAAVRQLTVWLASFPERYNGATDLYKTNRMNANVSLMAEAAAGDNTQGRMQDMTDRIHELLRSLTQARAQVAESDAQTGRVETARPK